MKMLLIYDCQQHDNGSTLTHTHACMDLNTPPFCFYFWLIDEIVVGKAKLTYKKLEIKQRYKQSEMSVRNNRFHWISVRRTQRRYCVHSSRLHVWKILTLGVFCRQLKMSMHVKHLHDGLHGRSANHVFENDYLIRIKRRQAAIFCFHVITDKNNSTVK